MNILIVSPTLNHGGAERVASLWAEGFAERGHRVVFVANIEKEEAYSLDERIHLLPLTYPKGNKICRYIGAIRRLRQYYKTYHPDVIIGVMYVCSLLAKLAELGLKIPVINTEHSAFEQPKDYPMLLSDRIAKYWLNYLYDGITILTKADFNIIKNRFKNLFVLPNPTFLTPLEDVPEKQNVVLAAGRLDAWGVKGFDVLIKAWGKVVESRESRVERKGWRLQIAGTGSEESLEYLKKLCKENGVEESVDFLGFRKDIVNLYKQSSVFVLSSRYEGFGMVLVEAMSQGCAPVVCDYKGRQKEIVGESGICCEPDDVEKLSFALKQMIDDKSFRFANQKRALCQSENYSKEKIMDKWESILCAIIS